MRYAAHQKQTQLPSYLQSVMINLLKFDDTMVPKEIFCDNMYLATAFGDLVLLAINSTESDRMVEILTL